MRSVVGLLVMAVVLAGLRVDLSVRSAAAMENGTGETVLTGSLNRQVTQGTDDAEEAIASGITTLTSSDLEFVNDPDGKIDQVVGMRFLNIDIPNGATIVNSYLIFTVDETSAIPTSLTIYGEAADNAATYAATLGNITQRAPTTALVQWAALPEWAEINTTQQTPSLNTLLQEIVRRPGWQAKNALAFMIRGNGRRTAFAYDGTKAKAPRLFVEWRLDPTPTPTASATAAATATATVPPTQTAQPTATATAPFTPTPTFTATPTVGIAPQCNRTGGAVRSIWIGIEGSLVSDLTKYKLYPESPNQVQIANRLETSPDMDDDYGELLQGYLCPPQSGDYIFWIAGDDQNQFWLSSDRTPQNRSLTAFIPAWTEYREWNKYPEQKSATIRLLANQAYYFEVLHKESIHGDSVSVAWQGPGFEQQIIEGRYLAPYANNVPTLVPTTTPTAVPSTGSKVYLPVVIR